MSIKIGGIYLIKGTYLLCQVIGLFTVESDIWEIIITNPSICIGDTQLKILSEDRDKIDSLSSTELSKSLRIANRRFSKIRCKQGNLTLFLNKVILINIEELYDSTKEHKILFKSFSFDDFYTYNPSNNVPNKDTLWRTGVKILEGQKFSLVPAHWDKYTWGRSFKKTLIHIIKTQKKFGDANK